MRAWDDAGRASPWSIPAFFETGLLEKSDWQARWITPDLPEDTSKSNPSPMLRRDFSLRGRIASGMNSFNHYAYGAVGDWLYRVVAGLDMDPATPGYRHLVIRPQPGGAFMFARATQMTPYGEAASGWRLVGDSLQVTVRVPANARALIRVPGARVADVRESGAVQSGDAVDLQVGSGDYTFMYASPVLAAKLRASNAWCAVAARQLIVLRNCGTTERLNGIVENNKKSKNNTSFYWRSTGVRRDMKHAFACLGATVC